MPANIFSLISLIFGSDACITFLWCGYLFSWGTRYLGSAVIFPSIAPLKHPLPKATVMVLAFSVGASQQGFSACYTWWRGMILVDSGDVSRPSLNLARPPSNRLAISVWPSACLYMTWASACCIYHASGLGEITYLKFLVIQITYLLMMLHPILDRLDSFCKHAVFAEGIASISFFVSKDSCKYWSLLSVAR